MAIPPIEKRLDSLIVSEREPEFEPSEIGDSEQVLVAGKLRGLRELLRPSEGVGARPRRGKAGQTQSEPAPSGEAAISDTAQIETSVPPMLEQPAAATPMTAPPSPAQPTPSLPQQLQTFEDRLPTAVAQGVPPETLINLNRIDGPEDFRQAVDALTVATGVKVDRLSWEDALAAAKEKGFGDSLYTELLALKQQYGDIPADIVRLRLATFQNSRDFYEAAKRAYLNPDDAQLQAELLYRLSLAGAIMDTNKFVATRAAQGTAIGRLQINEARAAGILEGAQGVKIPGINDAEMKAMLADPEVPPALRILVEKFVQLEDDAARQGLIDKVSKVGLALDLWDRTWKNGLLSGLGTHMVNLTSSTTFLASSVATRAAAGMVGSVRRGLGGTAEVELGEAAAMLAGIVNSTREGMSLAFTALRTGTTREMREGLELISDAGRKLEGQYNILDAKDYGLESEALIKGINAYANFVTLLGGRPIMAMDELFKTWGYRAELNAQAYRAYQQTLRNAMDGNPAMSAADAENLALKRMGEILGDPPPEIDEAARDFSYMITFTRKLTGSAARVQELAQDHLVGRIMLPFVKTPVWIASESLQNSALAPLSSKWRADFNAGGAARELAVAKMGLGSLMMIGAGSYVADGRMTGGGPGNTNLRNIYLADGWRPYSFVLNEGEWDQELVSYLRGVGIDASIGKNQRLYVPFRGIDPIAGPLAMVADAVEYARYEDDQDLTGQVLLGAVFGLYQYVGQQPFLQTVSSIGGAFTQSVPNVKAAFRNAIDAIVSTGTQYVVEGSPVGIFSGSRRMIERGIDPTRRMTAESPDTPTGVKGFFEGLNKVIAGTPILSETLGPQFDYLGQEMTDVDPSSPWLASMTGIRFSESKQRPADKIMIALGMGIKKPDMSITAGGVNIKLQPDEYQFLMRSLGAVTNSAGQTVSEAIPDLFTQPWFGDLGRDEQQINMRDLYGDFVNAAQQELLLNSPFSSAIERRVEAAQDRRPRVGIY